MWKDIEEGRFSSVCYQIAVIGWSGLDLSLDFGVVTVNSWIIYEDWLEFLFPSTGQHSRYNNQGNNQCIRYLIKEDKSNVLSFITPVLNNVIKKYNRAITSHFSSHTMT